MAKLMHISNNEYEYENLDTSKVWMKALKLLPTQVRVSLRVNFQTTDIKMSIYVPYLLSSLNHR
jgi:hypothetical protein